RDVDIVKIFASEPKSIPLEGFTIQRHLAMLAQLVKRRSLPRGQTNLVAFGLFKKQTRQSKNGIGNRARLDLRYHVFEYARIRQKTDRNLERRSRNQRTPIFSVIHSPARPAVARYLSGFPRIRFVEC